MVTVFPVPGESIDRQQRGDLPGRHRLECTAAPRRLPRARRDLLRGRAARRRRPAWRSRPRPLATVHDAILAVAAGEADRALVPFENSIEGSVRPTLDALAFDARGVTIAGEHDHPIRHALIARTELELGAIEVVVSHPQPSAQCARFLREELPGAEVRSAASTAEAVREVSESERPWAALGAASAAPIYGCVVLRDGVEDEHGNVTRFVWIAPEGVRAEGNGAVADDADLLRARRRPPRRAGRGADRVLRSRGQPGPDRVPPAPPGARPLHVLHRPRRGRHRPGRRRGDRRAAGQGRERPRPRQLPNFAGPASLSLEKTSLTPGRRRRRSVRDHSACPDPRIPRRHGQRGRP